MMMKVSATPIANDEKQIVPIVSYDVKCISMGLLVDKMSPSFGEAPWSWCHSTVLPNGCLGRTRLFTCRSATRHGRCTTHNGAGCRSQWIDHCNHSKPIAIQDAIRGVEMFNKLNVPILGIVENMSFLKLPDGSMIHPFGQGGGFETAVRYKSSAAGTTTTG